MSRPLSAQSRGEVVFLIEKPGLIEKIQLNWLMMSNTIEAACQKKGALSMRLFMP